MTFPFDKDNIKVVRVQGSGSSLGFRDKGSGFRVRVSQGFRVQGLAGWFRVQG